MRLSLAQPEPLPGKKKNCLFFLARPADIRAILILRECRPSRAGAVVEKIIRVKDLVSKKLVATAMELIRAGLCRQIDDSARNPTELRSHTVGLYFKL